MTSSPKPTNTFKYFQPNRSNSNTSPISPQPLNSPLNLPQVPSDMSATVARSSPTDIPIPRHHSTCSPHVPTIRSPSSSSLSSYRSHPYSRGGAHLSTSAHSPLESEELRGSPSQRPTLPKIHLPPPKPSSFAFERPSPTGESSRHFSSMALKSPSGEAPGISPRPSYTLPSVYALSGSYKSPEAREKVDKFIPKSMNSPPTPDRYKNEVRLSKVTSPSSSYPAPQLRPSYSYESGASSNSYTHHSKSPSWVTDRDREIAKAKELERERDIQLERMQHAQHDGHRHMEYSTPALRQTYEESSRQHQHSQRSQPQPQDQDRDRPVSASEPGSPPLRALPASYAASPNQHPYYTIATQARLSNTRPRAHSSASTQRKAGHGHSHNSQTSPDVAGGQSAPGQNRRLAHLMSEQKRRESINAGFTALRGVLPQAVPTDSKAVILRKAVAHIERLEAMMKRQDIPMYGGMMNSPLASSWKDSDYDSRSGLGRMIEVEGDDSPNASDSEDDDSQSASAEPHERRAKAGEAGDEVDDIDMDIDVRTTSGAHSMSREREVYVKREPAWGDVRERIKVEQSFERGM